MQVFVGLLLATLAGCSVTVQLSLNNKLTYYVGTMWTTFVSHAGGAILAIIIIAIISGSFSYANESILIGFRSALWYSFLGGVMGVITVASILFSMRTLPLGQVVAFITLGQLLLAAIFEKYGLFGLVPSQLDYKKVVGILLLAIGAYLMKSKS